MSRTAARFQHLGFDTGTEAMLCYWVHAPKFGFHWHYHPELEITFVQKGRGIRMVGDNVSYFEEGDFVFLGSNLPHTWISDDDFNEQKDQMEVIVLQFPPQLFSNTWLSFAEMAQFRRLFQLSRRGISFTGEERSIAAEQLIRIADMEGFERYNAILALLNHLGGARQVELLSSQSYVPPLNDATELRLLKVCQYIHDHYTEVIRLEEIARLANMNPSAFCRFFRRSTGQSFMEYVTDLRIGKAVNLLIGQRQMSISEIAYRSGFSSQTLFNRSFLKKKQMTPSQFRKLSSST